MNTCVCVCSACTFFVCVFTCTHCVSRRAHMCVPTGHVFVFQEDTCLLSDEHVCLCVCLLRMRMCVFICTHMCVPRAHICVFTCPHMCVPIGHVFVFQVNTCLFSDERTCVCVFRVRICIYIYKYVCVHVYTYVCSRVHTVVFQLDTRLCSRRPRVCYQMNTRVCLCFPRAHKCVCSHVQYTCVCSTFAVFTCTHMCVHVYTRLCSN